MSRRKAAKTIVHLTERTLQDLIAVEKYSVETWGRKTANRYVIDIESALQRLADHPDLLRSEPNLNESLYFYRVNQHLLVCDLQPNKILVLTVIHASMDVPERLIELEPTLKLEADVLHQQLLKNEKRSR